MWNADKEFVAWLDDEELGTDKTPLDDDTLDLMYRAWRAGRKAAAQADLDRKTKERRRII